MVHLDTTLEKSLSKKTETEEDDLGKSRPMGERAKARSVT